MFSVKNDGERRKLSMDLPFSIGRVNSSGSFIMLGLARITTFELSFRALRQIQQSWAAQDKLREESRSQIRPKRDVSLALDMTVRKS